VDGQREHGRERVLDEGGAARERVLDRESERVDRGPPAQGAVALGDCDPILEHPRNMPQARADELARVVEAGARPAG
jgi:hypothetical protein